MNQPLTKEMIIEECEVICRDLDQDTKYIQLQHLRSAVAGLKVEVKNFIEEYKQSLDRTIDREKRIMLMSRINTYQDCSKQIDLWLGAVLEAEAKNDNTRQ